MRKNIWTKYSVDAYNDTFKLIITQHYELDNETKFDSITFDFHSYAQLREFIDALELRGVEMSA